MKIVKYAVISVSLLLCAGCGYTAVPVEPGEASGSDKLQGSASSDTYDNTLNEAGFSALGHSIKEILDSCQGDWSVYIKDLSTRRALSINEHAMESASLIKLFIAGAVYEQLEQEKIQEDDTITSALEQMITLSDNESANILVRCMYDNETEDFQDGIERVNDFIQEYGFSNTRQINGLADPELWFNVDTPNVTSAADCGRLLELIYDGELISTSSSSRFEALLSNQQINYKIPTALPDSVQVAHKTGEISDVENDAAIIYTSNGDFIFCILSNDLTDTDTAVRRIHEVTLLVYNYFAQRES